MLNLRLAVLPLALLGGTAVSYPRAHAQDLSALKNSTAPTSTHLLGFAGREHKVKLGAKSYYAQADVSLSQQMDQQKALSEMYTAHQRRISAHKIDMLVVKTTNGLTLAALGGFGMGGKSPIVSGIGYVAKKGLDYVEKVAEEEGQKRIKLDLQTRMKKYEATMPPADYKKLLSEKNVDAFMAELAKRTDPVYGSRLDGVDPKYQGAVQNFYNRVIATNMKDSFKALADVTVLQGNQIEQNRRDIIGITQTFTLYAERTQEQLNGIAQAQEELRTSLNTLNDRVGRTEKGVEFIQQFMFAKMNPDEQISALRSGLFPDMPEGQRKDLEEKIALIQKRENLNKQVVGYLNGAQEVVNIANSLGVNSAVVNKLQAGVSIGNSAFKAFEAFSSGNLLGGISAVASIFGIGGRDIAGERHQEVMQALGGLYDQFGVVNEKLDNLLKGQAQIQKNQVMIYNAIITLSKQVESYHLEEMMKLERIERGVFYNRALINAEIAEKYGSCFQIRSSEPQFDIASGIYPTYDEFVAMYGNKRDQFDNCFPRLVTTRINAGLFPLNFRLETYEDKETDVGAYIRSVYNPSLDILLSDSRSKQKLISQHLSCLLAPMQTVADLDYKVTSVKDVWQPRFKLPFDVLMNHLLAPAAVRLHGDNVVRLHFLHQLFEPHPPKKPYTRDQLLRLEVDRRTGYDALSESLNLVDISIAQQNLLSGDILLPKLYEIFKKATETSSEPNKPDPDKKLYDRAENLLKANPVLARNFILYSLRREVLEKSNFLTYHLALGFKKDAKALQSTTVLPWQFQWRDEVKEGDNVKEEAGWYVKIGDNQHRLPTSEELAEGQLTHQPDVEALIALRERIAEEMASYEVLTSASPQQRLRYNSIILNSL